MNPLTFDQVQQEYAQWKLANPDKGYDLTTYAKLKDLEDGSPLRQQAYTDGALKRVNSAVENFFAPTGEMLAPVGAALDTAFRGVGGYGGHAGETAIQGAPRTFAEMAGYAAQPELGLLKAAPLAAKVLGSADAALNTYAQTDNPLAALISAASLPLTVAAGEFGGNVAAGGSLADLVTKAGTDEVGQSAVQDAALKASGVNPGATLGNNFARFAGSNLGMVGAQEVSRYGEEATTRQPLHNPFTVENLVQNVAGLAPFLPEAFHDMTGHMSPEQIRPLMDQYNARLQALDNGMQERAGGAFQPPTGTVDVARSTQRAAEQLDLPTNSLVTGVEPSSLLKPSEASKAFETAIAESPPGSEAQIERDGQDFRFMSADKVNTPEALAKFVNDVNATRAQRWEKAKVVEDEPTNLKAIDPRGLQAAFRARNPDIVAADKPSAKLRLVDEDAMNPEVIKQLRDEGLLRLITVDWLREHFQNDVNTALTGSIQEGYWHLVQKVTNAEDIIAKQVAEARRVKLINQGEQSSGEVKTAKNLASIETSTAKLPPEYQDRAKALTAQYQLPITRETTREGEPVRTPGGAEQNRFNNWRRQLEQIAGTYDPATKTVVLTNRTKDPATGALEETTRRVPIEVAFGTVPKLTPEGQSAGARQGDVSFDALSEEGTARESGSINEQDINAQDEVPVTSQLEDTAEEGTGPVAQVNPEDVTQLTEAQLTAQRESSSTNRAAEVSKGLERLMDPKQEQAAWGTFSELWAKQKDEKRRKFKTAVMALTGDRQSLNQLARMEFEEDIRNRGKALKEHDISSSMRSHALTNFWGPHGGVKMQRFYELLKQFGVGDGTIKYMKGMLDEGNLSFSMTGEPKSLQEGLKEAWETHYKLLGYGPTFTNHMVGLSMRMSEALRGIKDLKFTTLDLKDINTGERFTQEVSEQISKYGLHGTTYTTPDGVVHNVPFIALAMNHAAKNKDLQPAFNFTGMWVQAHEQIHELARKSHEWVNSADPDLRLQATIFNNAIGALDTLTPQDRYGMLVNLLDTMAPKSMIRTADGKMRKQINDWMTHGARDAEETMATYGGMYVLGLAGDGPALRLNDVVTALRWEGPAMQDFVRGVFRNLSDYTGGLIKTSDVSVWREMAGLPRLQGNAEARALGIKTIHEALNKLIRPDFETEKAKFQLAKYAQTLGDDMADFVMYPPSAPPTAPPDAPQSVNEALKQTHQLVFGVDPNQAVRSPSWWTKTFGTFLQRAAATNSPAAIDAGATLTDVPSAKYNLLNRIFSPIFKQNERGQWVPNYDSATRKLFDAGAESDKSRDVYNKLLGDVQVLMAENGKRNVVLKPDGTATDLFTQARGLNPDFDKAVGKKLEPLSPSQRGLVLQALDEHLTITRNAGLVKQEQFLQQAKDRTARIMQITGVPGDYNQLAQRAGMLVDGVLTKNAQLYTQAMQGLTPEDSISLIEAAGTQVEVYNQVKNVIDGQPFYASEQRPGDWMVEFGPADDRSYVGADNEAHGLKVVEHLKREGETNISAPYKKTDRYGAFSDGMPAQFAERFAQIEDAAFAKMVETIRAKYGGDVAGSIAREFRPGQAVLDSVTASTAKGTLKERRLAGGREYLDYWRTITSLGFSTAGARANSVARGKLDVLMNDPQFNNMPDFKARLIEQMRHTFQPSNEDLNVYKTITSGYMLGANFGSMIGNATQNVVVMPALIAADGGSTAKAWIGLSKAFKEVASWYINPADSIELAKAYIQGRDKSPEAAKAWAFQKFVAEHPAYSSYRDDISLTSDADLSAIVAGRNRHGNAEPLPKSTMVRNGLYQLAKRALVPYGLVENFNTKSAFKVSYDHALENKGLTPEQAYDYAVPFSLQGTYGGGKANQSGILVAASSGTAKFQPAVGMAMTLQNYALHMTTTMFQLGRRAIWNDPTMSPSARSAARAGFGNLIVTYTALAGGLGLPFAAAALTGLSKMTGVNITQALRQGIASLTGDDEELGSLISDIAMNGAANRVFGINIGSRVGLSSILGTNSYNGFNFKDLAGPVPSIFANMGQGILALSQGQIAQAATTMLPPTFRNAAQMIDSQQKYGQVQFMDKSNNMLWQPGTMEKIVYALGLRPTKLTQYQQEDNVMKMSGDLAAASQSSRIDDAARGLLHGDDTKLHEIISQMQEADSTIDPRDIVRRAIDKSIDMSTPKDLLAQAAPMGDRSMRRIISSTYPGPLNRQSEVQRLQMRDNAVSALGNPYGMQLSSREDMKRAQLVDFYVDQGLSKPEAARQVELMLSRSELAATLRPF